MMFPRCLSISRYSSTDIDGNRWPGPNTWSWRRARSAEAPAGRMVKGLKGCWRFVNKFLEIWWVGCTLPLGLISGPLPSGPPWGPGVSNFQVSSESFSRWSWGRPGGDGGAFRSRSSSCSELSSWACDWAYKDRSKRRVISRTTSSSSSSSASALDTTRRLAIRSKLFESVVLAWRGVLIAWRTPLVVVP